MSVLVVEVFVLEECEKAFYAFGVTGAELPELPVTGSAKESRGVSESLEESAANTLGKWQPVSGHCAEESRKCLHAW